MAADLRHPRMWCWPKFGRRSLLGGSTAAGRPWRGALGTERAPMRGGDAGLDALRKLVRELDVLHRQHALFAMTRRAVPARMGSPLPPALPSPADRRADVVMPGCAGAEWPPWSAKARRRRGLQRIICRRLRSSMQIEGLPFPTSERPRRCAYALLALAGGIAAGIMRVAESSKAQLLPSRKIQAARLE